jgi:hypothetical protein
VNSLKCTAHIEVEAERLEDIVEAHQVNPKRQEVSMKRNAALAAAQEDCMEARMKGVCVESKRSLVAAPEMPPQCIARALQTKLLQTSRELHLVIEIEAGIEIAETRQKLRLPSNVNRPWVPKKAGIV